MPLLPIDVFAEQVSGGGRLQKLALGRVGDSFSVKMEMGWTVGVDADPEAIEIVNAALPGARALAAEGRLADNPDSVSGLENGKLSAKPKGLRVMLEVSTAPQFSAEVQALSYSWTGIGGDYVVRFGAIVSQEVVDVLVGKLEREVSLSLLSSQPLLLVA